MFFLIFMALSILLNDFCGNCKTNSDVINALITESIQKLKKNHNFLKITAFSILFNELWTHYKEISGAINTLKTQNLQKLKNNS